MRVNRGDLIIVISKDYDKSTGKWSFNAARTYSWIINPLFGKLGIVTKTFDDIESVQRQMRFERIENAKRAIGTFCEVKFIGIDVTCIIFVRDLDVLQAAE